MGDRLYQGLQRKLPDYQHSFVYAKLIRIIAKVSAGEKLCATMFKTPERESLALFSSEALGLLPSPRLVIASNKEDDFRRQTGWEGGKISLRKLIKEHKTLRLGLISGYSYGQELDTQLKTLNKKNHIYRHSGFNSPQALLHMLLAGRVDFILEHSWMMKYILKDTDGRVTLIPIADAPLYVEAFIACPKNQWGQKIIGEINLAIRKSRNESRQAIEHWLNNSEITAYRKSYNEHFNTENMD